MKVLLNNNKEVEVEKIVYRNHKGKLMCLPVEDIKKIIDGKMAKSIDKNLKKGNKSCMK